MDRSDRIIFVAGATGHQGGASARHLLAEGWRVRALTRDPSQPSARALADLGAEVVRGDLTDRASLGRLLHGMYGVHSVETAREGGPDVEMEEGRNLADAAKEAGVHHFVYSSVNGAHNPDSPRSWVQSKHELEQYIANIGLPWTVWRPSTFMENYLRQRESIVGDGILRGAEPPDLLRQMIAVDDIGRFVALAFADRETWLHKATEIAGDRMPMAEVAQVFGNALGRDVRYEQTPLPEGMPAPTPPPVIVDLYDMRTLVPELKTLEEWAANLDWHQEMAGAGRVGGRLANRY